MATEVKTKTLLYKACAFHTGRHDLRQLVSAALAEKATVGSRRQNLAPEGESPIWQVIAQSKEDEAFVFGLMVQYTPGMVPSFLVDDEAALSLAVEHLNAPKTDDGKDRQLLEAMLFFAVMGNHLVLLQSQSLKSLQFERHLQWLLHTAGKLAGDNTIRLNDSLPRAIKERLEQTSVRGLTVDGDFVPAPVAPAPAAPTPSAPARAVQGEVSRLVASSVQVQSSTGSPAIIEMLKSLVGQSKAAQLKLDEVDGSNIEYSLQIRYKRQTTEQGQRLMNTLGSALRHAEGVETKIQLVGGGSISGSEMKLSGPVRINTVNGVPSPDDVFEAMRTWLLDRVKSGDIGRS